MVADRHKPDALGVPRPAGSEQNEWRGELGQPRVVCIGPKARAILLRHKDGGDVPFSPVRAMAEYIAARHAARVTPVYGKRKDAPHVPRVLGERWTTDAYTKTMPGSSRGARTGSATLSARRFAGRSVWKRRGPSWGTQTAAA